MRMQHGFTVLALDGANFEAINVEEPFVTMLRYGEFLLDFVFLLGVLQCPEEKTRRVVDGPSVTVPINI